MERLTSREAVLQRLAILDEQIERLQQRLVKLQQRQGHPPTEDLEQTLATLVVSRAVLRGWSELLYGALH